MSDAPCLIVLTTLPADGHDPAHFARTLVERRLAACVSVLAPMQSTYRWQGHVEQAAEHQVLIKTTNDRLSDLTHALTELHPYDVPELLVLPVSDGGDAYLAWIRSSVAAMG
jgi:periplasmic divalent cation tolerance protein